MPQATSLPERASVVPGPSGGPWEDDLFRGLSTLITRLRRQSGDSSAESSARTFLLGHVDRLGPVRMSDLATHACLDQSTVSRHLRSLEEQGYVARTADPDDRRATLLELSPTGREVLDHAIRARTRLIAEASQHWSDEDRTALATLIIRLAHDLENDAP